ncbi:phosphate ABC transporter ATP-binding protein [Proteinivorax tanatarense]|uniref:Phosphate ABC transporter ATP-binding protein n=1 Tax=Proteinivorax tanatarense TaxID=1260629 RepID=A0AAU7VK85_9FIRM
MTNQNIFQLKNVSKSYGKKTVLNIDNLNIIKGEILALVGPSGAGKSTLLRLMNFVESADTGEIIYMDKKYNNKSRPKLSAKRTITTVFQRPSLMNTSVWKNIVYPLKIRNIEIDEHKINQLISKLGLSKLKNQKADKLSGGEAQRVSIGRALVFNPQVLLLDEPTSNLDPTNVKIIEDIIDDYVKKEKATVIMVTHNIFQAKRLADKVCLINQGNLVEINDKNTFFDNPQHSITKKFLSGELIY